MRTFYPIVADLAGKRCLVVGGGRVAERKVGGLLEASAAVAVVSPLISDTIAAWEAEGRVTVVRREYTEGDAAGASLVFAATDKREVNERVYAEAVARALPVNVADRPDLCTFVVPAVIRSGPLLVTVSTSGTSPMASARIRDRIEESLGEGLDRFLEFTAEYRLSVHNKVSDPGLRRKLLAELFSDEALDAVKAGDWESFRSRMLAQLNEA
ncbi:MAG: siroheme synthase [Paenibacillus sp.]|jgi:precorrin-2 dehydrogenase/sirohydrochlorin ferrochelatase|uniref:precorrin-2 dehydrogenase/sirohydrochlorin ferrochelatase family protein n=1 Tax=Paenibacillus sp. GCM10012303 TaxID=3317340 RepID=UPI0029E8DA7E|nr:siroheme synthase [Paenibacillus sp.]